MKTFKYAAIAFLGVTLLLKQSLGQQTDGPLEMQPLDCVRVYQELPLDSKSDQSLLVDLYIPEKTADKPPLLVWIYGSGQSNSKPQLDAMLLDLTDKGYAVATFDSRSNGSLRPEHVNDGKGAIRWLQAHAEEYGYDTTRIGLVGGSGGAALALMLGTTANVDELEGLVAGNLDQSSRVHAVVNFDEPRDASEALDKLGLSRDDLFSPDLPDAESLFKFITPDDAPLLVIQGNRRASARVNPNRQLYERYQEAGVEATLCRLQVVGHEGQHFSDRAKFAMVLAFFDKHIKQIPYDIFAESPQPSISSDANENESSDTPAQTDRRRQRRQLSGERFVSRGVQVGQVVPDLTVYTLAGESLKLSSMWKQKPTVLVTASITCPIAYRNCPSLRPLQDDYGDAVNVVILYRREAHAKPEGPAANRPNPRFRGTTAEKYPQPKTLPERLSLAKLFDQHMSSAVRLVVADISDDMLEVLGPGPNMGLLINSDGKLVVKQGWYDGETMRTEVAELVAEVSDYSK